MQAASESAPDLPDILRRAFSQEREALIALVVAAHASLEVDPVAESGRGRFVAWLRAEEAQGSDQVAHWEQLDFELIDDVMIIGAGISDHLRALELCLVAGPPLQTSIVTLGRAIFEATVRLCYLLESSVSPAQHTLRAAAQWADKFESTERTARSYDHDPQELAAIAERADEMHTALATMGFTRVAGGWNSRYTTNLGLQGEVANVSFNMTSAAKRYIAGVDFAWSVLSGAAHSKSWYINSAYGFDGEDDSKITAPEETHALVLLLLFAASDAFVDAVCLWAGLNANALHDETHRRRIAVSQGIQSEMADFRSYAEYRALVSR
ncbi:hypothetical protein BH10ACT6_BH10ACT6_12710 [soil metagenome]